jgi:hypothetical protein
MNKFLTYILILISTCFTNSIVAQVKFEKESRIKQSAVPFNALTFIDSIAIKRKIKWFKEEGISYTSFEAKFKHNKSKYSVEFDSLGNIEDIEVTIKWDELEKSIQENISLVLNNDCTANKVVKLQQQFTGNSSDLIFLFKHNSNINNLSIQFEAIVRCKKDKKTDLFEYLFNNSGRPISSKKIILKNSSHLEY